MHRFLLTVVVVFLLVCLGIPGDLNAQDVTLHIDRGNFFERKGEHDKAIAEYNKAIQLSPAFGMGYYNRGLAWKAKGEYAKAIADYDKSIEVDSDDPHAYSNLAWLQATCPDKQFRDGEKAIQNATRAYDLDNGQHWQPIESLAAAHAEKGDFKKARDWLATALDIATKNHSMTGEEKRELRSCEELFKQGKPYRDELKKK